jgi:glycosyltransferase involved in cell wall biosynthesis
MVCTPMSDRQQVSLIIATYNRGPRIGRTLDSVLAQTLQPQEIIIVDDCSSDGTVEWVREYYPKIRVVRPEKNLRTSGARNLGARQATGNIFVFLDHDDELLPHAIETLAGLLRDHPEARAAHADHVYNNAVDGIHYPNHHSSQTAFARLRRVRPQRVSASARVYSSELHHALLWGNLLQQPWAVYRDSFFIAGEFSEDVRYCEDWDIYLRLTRLFPIVLSDSVISIHHVDGENLHLRGGQEEMHMRVLQRCLCATGWFELRTRWVVNRRLAMYYKTAGDNVRRHNLSEAWRRYLRSIASWPFDYVVVGRLILWPLQGLWKRFGKGFHGKKVDSAVSDSSEL